MFFVSWNVLTELQASFAMQGHIQNFSWGEGGSIISCHEFLDLASPSLPHLTFSSGAHFQNHTFGHFWLFICLTKDNTVLSLVLTPLICLDWLYIWAIFFFTYIYFYTEFNNDNTLCPRGVLSDFHIIHWLETNGQDFLICTMYTSKYF